MYCQKGIIISKLICPIISIYVTVGNTQNLTLLIKKKNLNNNYVVYARGVADTTSIYDNNYLQSKNTALKKKNYLLIEY